MYHRNSSIKPISLVLLLTVLSVFSPAGSPAQAPRKYAPEPIYKKVETRSFYLTMRDGVELAVDLHLPAKLPEGKRIPTILHQTRYWRSLDLRWPFSNMIEPGPPTLWAIISTKALLEQGYALVSVDVRGTGASKSVRTMEMSREEVEDGVEIMDWIVQQPWSDGNIGATGISYNGWGAQMLAIEGHPALKCIVPIHAPFDGFDEMTHPGGVRNEYMLNDWSWICEVMDKNYLPSKMKGKNLVVNGFAVVEKGHKKRQREALLGIHEQNDYVDDVLRKIEYREDRVQGLGDMRIDSLFPCGFVEQIQASKVPVYSFSGWYDISGAKSAVRQFLNYGADWKSMKNKIILGAWNHGGRKKVSPFGEKVPIELDRTGEALKFFDHHLKGLDNGLYEEPRVHFYHMGEEKWRSSETWPVAGMENQTFYLAPGGKMALEEAPAKGRSVMRSDTNARTGKNSRWNLAGSNECHYDSLLKHSGELHAYTSPPFTQAVEVTGTATLRLVLQSEEQDATVFAFLIDVAPDGTRRVMTQGHVRVSHAKQHQAGPYKDAIPYLSYKREDMRPLEPGVARGVEIVFHPVSWRVQKGHSLRLALTGSDLSHFLPLKEETFDIELLFGGRTPSHLLLPSTLAN